MQQNDFLSLHAVAAYVPERSVTVEQLAPSLGVNRFQARMFRRVHGFENLREDPDIDLFDLVLPPAREVLRTVPDPEVIRYVLYAHTVLDVTPARMNAAGIIGARLGLSPVECFAVTQQYCASGLAALDIAAELLRGDGDPEARALVVTGEKPFTPVIRLVANTTIVGEASSACLVGIGGQRDRVLSYATRTLGLFSEGVRLPPDALKEFNDTYTPNLVEVLRDAVDQAGIALSDITLVVPHNVSRLLWWRTATALGIDRERVYLDTISEYSHCCCSDPILNFVSLRDSGQLSRGGYYLLTSVGMGATYAAMVIEH